MYAKFCSDVVTSFWFGMTLSCGIVAFFAPLVVLGALCVAGMCMVDKWTDGK